VRVGEAEGVVQRGTGGRRETGACFPLSDPTDLAAVGFATSWRGNQSGLAGHEQRGREPTTRRRSEMATQRKIQGGRRSIGPAALSMGAGASERPVAEDGAEPPPAAVLVTGSKGAGVAAEAMVGGARRLGGGGHEGSHPGREG
jgi:hypothetical protein